MKIKSHSLTPFSLTSLALCSVLVLPLSAKDDIVGTPDTDSDGDGDPVPDGSIIVTTLAGEGKGTASNFLGLISKPDVPTEYWVTAEKGTNHWEDYTASPNTQQQLAARVLQTLNPGDAYFYRQSASKGFEEFTMRWRESNSMLPSGTKISFGFGFGGSPMQIDGGTVEGESNLTNLSGSDGPATGTTTNPSGYDGSLGSYLWYNYEVDKFDKQAVFAIKDPTFEGNPAVVGDIIWYLEFPDTIPDGESMPSFTPWALSGFDKDGDFESVTPGDDYYLSALGKNDPAGVQNDDPTEDLIFSWTVDNKTAQYGGPNVNFVPEPSVALLSVFSMLAVAFRRKRH